MTTAASTQPTTRRTSSSIRRMPAAPTKSSQAVSGSTMGRRSATLSAMSATVPKLARARRLSRTSTKGGVPVPFLPLNEYIRNAQCHCERQMDRPVQIGRRHAEYGGPHVVSGEEDESPFHELVREGPLRCVGLDTHFRKPISLKRFSAPGWSGPPTFCQAVAGSNPA